MMRRASTGHELADPQAFFPGSRIVPVAAERILRLIQISVVGGDHAPLGTVHEDGRTAGCGFELLAERADQIRAENTHVVSEDFGDEPRS